MPANLKQQAVEAEKRQWKRAGSPGLMLEPAKDGGFLATAPFDDLEAWEVLICDSFGTRSRSLVRTFVAQLRELCAQAWDDDKRAWKPSETELNAALAFIAGNRPRNEAEAALVAQMLTVHWMQMRMAKQALRSGYMDHRDASIAGKLARTYAMQLDALGRARGRGTAKQSIKVRKETHQHVHYHDHRGAGENGRQPHGPTEGRTIDSGSCEPAERAALPSPEPCGQVVPLASHRRKAGVSGSRG